LLVLSRKVDQTIVIQHNITIKILEITGDRVKLGINAPRDVQVHREEVWRELQAANRAAASPTEDAVKAVNRMLTPPA